MKDGVTKYPEDFLRESNCVMCSLTLFHFNIPITVSLISSHVKRLELRRVTFLFDIEELIDSIAKTEWIHKNLHFKVYSFLTFSY